MNELQTVNPNLPAYMQEIAADAEYQQHLANYIIPPMLKIIQPTYKGDDFQKGDVILSPQKVPLPKQFYFTPLFFYPEWLHKNPNGISPFIIDRSLDPNSELAANTKSKETWSYPCPKDVDKLCRYDEHLNFVCIIEGEHELKGTPVVISFACGEFKTGRSFLNSLALRKTPQPYCNRFMATVVQRDNEGSTYGLDISAPEDGNPWTDEALMPAYIKAADMMKKSVDKLRPGYESDPDAPVDPSEF